VSLGNPIIPTPRHSYTKGEFSSLKYCATSYSATITVLLTNQTIVRHLRNMLLYSSRGGQSQNDSSLRKNIGCLTRPRQRHLDILSKKEKNWSKISSIFVQSITMFFMRVFGSR